MNPRSCGLLAGYLADRIVGDPRRFHPVAGFGRSAAALERRVYADSRGRGAAYTTILMAGVVGAGAVAQRRATSPVAHTLATALATWAVLGGRSLEREASAVGAFLMVGDLPAARRQAGRLVGRDTGGLDASEVARAVIESVAENTSDAVVAPLVWGAVAGIPGLLGYRAANTLDAMVGHHNARYESFGWAAARLDDALNLPGSRLSGLLTLVARPSRAGTSWRTWRSDAAAHPSPNGGVIEAAFAGALGIRLGGTNHYYGSRVEHRAILGTGHSPEPGDVAEAIVLAKRVALGAALVTAWFAGRRDRLRAR